MKNKVKKLYMKVEVTTKTIPAAVEKKKAVQEVKIAAAVTILLVHQKKK